MDDISYHARLVDMFTDAEEASEKSRRKAERDIDYYDGKQWTEQEVKELRKRGQPAITMNMVRNKIDFLQGQERVQRTKPRALPRTPQHEQDSSAVTDALQYACDDNEYGELRSRCWGDMLKGGWCGMEVVAEPRQQVQPGSPEYKIVIRRCQWDRMFWDPYSVEEDFSDASYLGMVLWMDREEAVRRYGEGAAQVFDDTVRFTATNETFDDKPKLTTWVTHGKRRRVRIVQMYFLADDGEWDFCEFTKGGVLMDGPSPWLDEEGKRQHPFSWRSAYVDRDNNRYGAIRDMIDPQDELNKRRSKFLHLVTARQTYGNQKIGMEVNDLKKQLSRPDGHIEMQGDAKFGEDFGVIPNNDFAQGHFELLSQTTAFFETVGPNAAMQGKKQANESGRAILAQQQGGAIQMGTLTDALRQMDFDAYRKVWLRIRQFWTGETWIRVTDDERNLRWVGLNQPQMDEFGNVIAVQNNITELDVDIIIDDAPASGTLLDEQWEGLVGLAQAGVQFPPPVYIKAMPNLRNKDELLQLLEQAQQAQAEPNPLMMAGAEAEVAETQANAALKHAQAVKTQAEAENKNLETQIDLAVALTPQPVPVPSY